MPQSQAALTFAQWGTPPETVPHSPPWWYQSTCSLRRKRPYAAYTRLIRALQRVTISLLSRACLYPPPPRRPGFSFAPGPMQQGVSYVQISGLGVYMRNIIPDDVSIPSSASLPYRGGAMGFPLLASGARRERRRRPVRIPITERERSKYLRGAPYLLIARPAIRLGLVSSSSGSGLSGFGLYNALGRAVFDISHSSLLARP